MNAIWLLLIFIASSVTLCDSLVWNEGDLCNPTAHKRPNVKDEASFFECVSKSGGTGEWTIKSCPDGLGFDMLNQTCISLKLIKEQNELCLELECQNYVCLGAQYQAAVGSQCSWISSSYYPFGWSNQYYLQCNPVSTGAVCGQWATVACPASYSYNAQMGVCVLSAQQGRCPLNQVGVCPCYNINQCPTGQTCTFGICCTATTPVVTNALCPNNVRSTVACTTNTQCQNSFACYTGGCCSLPRCTDGRYALQFCTGTGRGTCPVNYLCVGGGCCFASTVNVRCADGSLTTRLCTTISQCLSGQSCQNGGCCAVTGAVRCPDGTTASNTCASNVQCAGGRSCQNGGCCAVAVTVRCPDGTTASNTCATNTQCVGGRTCQNGGCCSAPALQCPSGLTGTQTCLGAGQSTCTAGTSCQNGVCCLFNVRCVNGQPASTPCIGTGQSTCPVSQTCQNGGCCTQILRCPDGTTTSQSCQGATQSTCSIGNLCQGAACCRLRNCANGQVPIQSCTGTGQSTCLNGFGCQNGFCCQNQQQTRCLDGTIATITCTGTAQGTYPLGFYCNVASCCPLPTCPNGQPAITVCGTGNACPANTQCSNGGCCALQLSTCPNGQAALASCTTPQDCTGQFQYCSNGGCCEIPVCQDGSRAQSPCNTANPCPANQECQNGGCCPAANQIAQCPNGVVGSASCTGTGQGTCGTNLICINSACCAGSTVCLGTTTFVQICSPSGQCPAGSVCTLGACCGSQQRPIRCNDGSNAITRCNGIGQSTCPNGYYCQNTGCCQLPRCLDGSTASTTCINGQCPVGTECYQGLSCCRATAPQQCPTNQPPIQVCGVGNSCPAGFFCLQGQCCSQQLPTCPNGQQALQLCTPANPCGAGRSCFNGGCCPTNGVRLVDPSNVCQRPLVTCGAKGLCPFGSSCKSSICCATSTIIFSSSVPPGGTCTDSIDCNGDTMYTDCFRGFCACVGGARSNGVTCVRSLASTLLQGSIPEDSVISDVYWKPLSPNRRCKDMYDCVPMFSCINSICSESNSTSATEARKTLAAELNSRRFHCSSNNDCLARSECDQKSQMLDQCKTMFCDNQLKLCGCPSNTFLHRNTCVSRCTFGYKSIAQMCIPTLESEFV